MKLHIKPTQKIQGEIQISGSKNAALALIMVCLLTKEKIILDNVPNISDVKKMLRFLTLGGVKSKFTNHRLELVYQSVTHNFLSLEAKMFRASYYCLGALFNEFDQYSLYIPGGCNFCERPIEFHLDLLKQAGAMIIQKNDTITVMISKRVPFTYVCPQKSVGLTVNFLLLSSKNPFECILKNAAIEPEVFDLIDCLIKMGVMIHVKGSTIIVKGLRELKGVTHPLISDRIEAGSYLLLAVSHPESRITIYPNPQKQMKEVIKTIKKMGGVFHSTKNSLTLISPKELTSIDVVAKPYPGFPTDLKSILAATLLQTKKGVSRLKDEVYPKRFSEEELTKIGARYLIQEGQLQILPSTIKGGVLKVRDLRCGFSEIVAASFAEKEVCLEQAEVIYRGYEDVLTKLGLLGVQIKE
jgi:UDP-N-acetylglucosamine 1-carboxyvinyltransferase